MVQVKFLLWMAVILSSLVLAISFGIYLSNHNVWKEQPWSEVNQLPYSQKL